MAEINGEFPRYTEPNKKSGQKKGKTKKLKRKLREMEYKLKYQKKLAKVHIPDREPRLHGVLAPPCRKGAPLFHEQF